MPSVAETIAATLRTNGIRRIFGLPGGEIAELMGACRQVGIEFVLTRHENAACIMAGVTGEITRRPGVVMATMGPGATNLVNGVANAFLERAPLLALSAQVPTAVAPVLPHQRVDLRDLFRPITKWSEECDGTDTSRRVQRALDLAAQGRPGPVYLALPSDVARQDDRPVSAGADAAEEPPEGSTPRRATDPALLDRASRLIAAANRPLAVAGIGLDPVASRPFLLRFLEATRIPVATTPKAKGLVPEDHPQFLATCTGMAGDGLFMDFLGGADLLIGIGFDPVEAIRVFYTQRPFLSLARYSLADRDFRPTLEVVGEVQTTLPALQALGTPRNSWRPEELAGFRRRLAAHLTPQAEDAHPGFSPTRALLRLREIAPRQTILTVDTGAHKLLAGQVWPSYEPQTYFVSHGLSTMGFALPAAIAVKLERPEAPVIALTGDGGLAMVLGELETAARLKLPVVVVVFVDRGLHLIRLHQERKGVEPNGVDFGPIDFAGIAPGFGARGVRVRAWSVMEDAVRDGLATDRPTVIEIPIDPSEYGRML
ncbi:MAG: thiamine pyrophosphate-binding protein [candidate division NC10 bacterium]|nr:thiamine pyrophosphate-binding protein [candidate division NC10 bacterium]